MEPETLDTLTAYWNSRVGPSLEVDEDALDRKIDPFIAYLEDKVFPDKLVRADDSWWALESSLYREYFLLEDEATWVILISRCQFFVTSLLQDDVRTLDHASVVACSIENGFRYVPNVLLSGQTPGTLPNSWSWRTALFSEA
ncbi:hypothetical protein [Roseimicrobium sp. ORNL1]|uniref:hypothetical protein n=1 Tax=Roseimicrobium sp. ORNL1 TaxID=2711231 RepID=UPI0013E1BF82|nr:hypothetical protein [Roseimicrobium sp. ORNL1]QIF03337.1 hypothetical protein G5S37_18010 [Roseimicrobium sp. ORNL1]